MKIKCPSCAKVLNVPESAQGKSVKCPCGTQIKVPAAAPAPQEGSPRSVGELGIDDRLFDELTEADLATAKPPPEEVEEEVVEETKPKKSKRDILLVILLLVVIAGIFGGVTYFFIL